ncbi:PTS system mannose/fructose/sorbose family transporter subunit IID [Neobacillus kokaensis]|uniref:PTS mannose transporter subunit IID n=1 Tax=Neobacillus kokaensis TaxID=2759023 RepID=A0ABQ3N3H6_9BACI|nr:PTS system mannose/fructose/sorbose family transporter subunit IID [Neobacillus kokaensis]GHH98626.1 PTS mannose transporter subunit IID [Neobacillus kokaensis]
MTSGNDMVENNKDIEGKDNSDTHLNKKDLWKTYLYSQGFVTGFNYSKQEAPGFMFSMIPVLEKIYKDEDEKREAYLRHSELFLTEARLSHFVIGMTAAMEERNANEKDIDPRSIGAIKSALMGPLAGIGDSLYHGTLRPIMAGLAISLVVASNHTSVIGPILFVFVMALVGQLLRGLGIFKGYKFGVDFVAKVQSSGILGKLTHYAGIAAYVVIGGFVYKFVNMNLAWSYKAGETVVSLQKTLDGLIPGLLPVIYTLLMYYLLSKKKVGAVTLIVITMAVGIVGVLLGILK